MIKKTDGKTREGMTGTVGDALEDAGFEPLGRRIKLGHARRASSHPGVVWFAPVVDFLSETLPGAAGSWQHLHIGAYEAACEALVRLGHAAPTAYGAKHVYEARTPDILPRWDDIATIVVCAASQSDILEYHHFPGAPPGARPRGLARANILAAHGSGPAYLEPQAIPTFESLGLILGGRWTEAAETIIWRDRPAEWAIDFTSDDRFARASDLTIATLPQQIADEINKVTTIRERDIVEWLAFAELHAETPRTRQDALKSLRFWCVFGLDSIFHRRWRLNDGWLDADEAKRAIYMPHDPVALNMRAAFAARYLPELPFLQE